MSEIKSVFKYLILIFIVLTFVNCKSFENENKVKFIIHSQKTSPFNDIFATVYVSDTSWMQIADFADSLVKGYGFFSTVSFYTDSNNIPIINEVYSYYPYDIESIADYKIQNSLRISQNRKEIDETEDLSFKLVNNNGIVVELNESYSIDYKIVNSIINYQNNYDSYGQGTQKTASDFINLLLESNLDKLSNLFIGEIDEEQVQNIHEILLSTEWDKVRKSEGGSAEKYNLWYVQRSFVKDMDTLKIKIHFDVNKAADKIESVEYSYVE